jgi:hypothetical protein
MKVPTDATKVFSPNRWTSGTGSTITTNFPVDLQIGRWMGGDDNNVVQDRLRGLNSITTDSSQPRLFTNTTAAEALRTSLNYGFNNTGFLVGANNDANGWTVNFKRAPSFFDEVCYTGTGTNGLQVAHNLGVAPELIIIKSRNGGYNWQVSYSSNGYDGRLYLNTTDELLNSGLSPVPASGDANYITLRAISTANSNAITYVAYLFATCPGVSKVGSYTGTGTTKQIDCGFTGGARFVLIKKTSGTGSWYVWDSARGIVSGNDPYLLLNSTAAEVTNTDYIDTYSAGFEISSTAPSEINENGGSFIFFAVA